MVMVCILLVFMVSGFVGVARRNCRSPLAAVTGQAGTSLDRGECQSGDDEGEGKSGEDAHARPAGGSCRPPVLSARLALGESVV